MGAIVTLTAILIGLYLVLKIKSGDKNAFETLADPLSKTFGSIISVLQGK